MDIYMYIKTDKGNTSWLISLSWQPIHVLLCWLANIVFSFVNINRVLTINCYIMLLQLISIVTAIDTDETLHLHAYKLLMYKLVLHVFDFYLK